MDKNGTIIPRTCPTVSHNQQHLSKLSRPIIESDYIYKFTILCGAMKKTFRVFKALLN